MPGFYMGHGWKKPPKKMMEKTPKTSPIFKRVSLHVYQPQKRMEKQRFLIFWFSKNLALYSREQKQAFPAGRWHNQRSWPRRSFHSNSDRGSWTDHPVWRACSRRHHSQLRQRRGNGLTILSIYILLFEVAFCKSTFFVHFLVSTFK